MKLVLVGMNHRTAPVEVRERFAIEDPVPVLQKLVDSEDVQEVAILSTCNRVEVIATTVNTDAARHRLIRFFQNEWATESDRDDTVSLEESLYVYQDSEAVAHLFGVASAIDSMVVGEPQILGQVKDAYRMAVESGASGPILSRLFQRSFTTAKRVRTETRMAEGPVSVARVGVEVVGQVFENLESKRALLIGAGEMVETALETLRREGLGHVSIANRTLSHAEELARRFDAHAFSLEDLPSLLEKSDIVLTSVGGDGPILLHADIAESVRRRRSGPMVVIDIGVPRNVDPDVDRIDNVYLYNIDDLQEIAAVNAEDRLREVARARRIVQAEAERFEGWLAALKAVPTIRHLTQRSEDVRQAEVERSMDRLDLSDAQREGVEVLTRSLVSKLLHFPLRNLRQASDREEGIAMLEAARALFGLDESDSEAREDPSDSDPEEQ